MKRIKKEAEEKSSWWYWFKKSDDGKYAICNNCDWTKERGTACSTSILRSHLKTKHADFFSEKLDAEKDEQKIGKFGVKKKKEEAMEESDFEEELDDESTTIQQNSLLKGHEESELAKIDNLNRDEAEFMKELDLNLNKVLYSMMGNFDYNNYISQNGIASTSKTTNHQSTAITDVSCSLNDVSKQFNQTSNKSTQNMSSNVDNKQQVVKICRIESFSSAHRLHNPKFDMVLNKEIYGKCNNTNGHGHNYKWKVVLLGNVDPETGMVYNMSDLKREMAEVIEQVDHKNLDKDIKYFRDNGIVSTTENLAVFLFNELAMRMKSPQLLKKVVVYETDKNSFSYSRTT